MSTYNVIEVAPDGSLRPSTRELVAPESGQARIRVDYCGICHTDGLGIHAHPADEAGRVPGHEIVGVVDALGEGVEGWEVGQRVGVGFLGGHCGTCESCRRGNFVACTNQPMTGITVDGGYAEIVYARATGLVAIPDDLSSVDAAPLLCAGFTTYNALLKGGVKAGDLVAIQGIGGLGHLGLQYARKMGLRVVAIARGHEKESLARELGAQHYIDSVATDAGEELKKLGGAQVIVATAAAGSATTALVNGLAVGGRMVVVGASDQPIEVAPAQLIFGDIDITGSLTGSAIENEDNLRFALDQGVRSMSEVLPLQEAAEGFDRMVSGAARFRMVLSV
jgi:propanol-preferring alcohol dehydrogenase